MAYEVTITGASMSKIGEQAKKLAEDLGKLESAGTPAVAPTAPPLPTPAPTMVPPAAPPVAPPTGPPAALSVVSSPPMTPLPEQVKAAMEQCQAKHGTEFVTNIIHQASGVYKISDVDPALYNAIYTACLGA